MAAKWSNEAPTAGMADISLDAAGGAGGDAGVTAGGGDSAGGAGGEDIAAFWTAEYEWHDACAAEPLLVMISDPKTTSGFKSYTTYLVKCALAPSGVRRRFSDWEWLRNLLRSRYDGCVVPAMPEKRVMNQGKEFIEGRMADLTDFTNEVTRNSYLRHDASLVKFLTCSDSSAWDAYKKSTVASPEPGAAREDNEGLERWEAVLNMFPLPDDAEAAMTSLQHMTRETGTAVQGVLHAARKFMDRSAAYAASLQELKDSVNAWKVKTTPIVDEMPDALEVTSAHSGALLESLGHASTAMAQWHDLACFQPNEVRLFLVTGMEVELQKIRAFNDLISAREAAQQAYTNAWHQLDRAEFQQKKLSDSGKAEKAAKMDGNIANLQKSVKIAKTKVDNITKGILGSESGRRVLDRARRFASTYGQLASLNIASGLRAQQLWSSFLMDVNLNTEEMVGLAQKTLAGERGHLRRDSSLQESLDLTAAAGGGVDEVAADEGGETPSMGFDDFVDAGESAEPALSATGAPPAPSADVPVEDADEGGFAGEDVRDDISL